MRLGYGRHAVSHSFLLLATSGLRASEIPGQSSRGRQEHGGGTYPAGCDRAGCSGRSVGARARALAAETRHLPPAEVRAPGASRGRGVGGVALGCVLGGDSSRCFLAQAPEAPPPRAAEPPPRSPG